jgi:FtsP/CotA-like multicopper oxidase with cupredoxin domain
MEPDPLGRREFLAGGGLFICTLAGHKLLANKPVDVDALAKEVKVPPKVAAYEEGGGVAQQDAKTELAAFNPASSGNRREYWIQAEPVRWRIVPTGRDQMMGRRIRGKTKFTAFAYRRYTSGFGSPVGPATIPGPLIEAEVGDTVVVNFRNKLRSPVTVHPHGIFYPNEMDGAYKGKFTDPGGFVQHNRTFQYVWEAHPGTEGAWLYHDHGPIDPLGVFKGLFGPLIIRPAGGPRPDREFFLAFHSFQPIATHLRRSFSCINGRSYAGNTPNLTAKVGDKVAFHIFAIDNDFHTFHLHGHRWQDPNGGKIIDNQTLGPADSITAEFVEDNPGRWFYHCHVFTHLHMGMNGWYTVS